jgi:hypothetical protein
VKPKNVDSRVTMNIGTVLVPTDENEQKGLCRTDPYVSPQSLFFGVIKVYLC